MKKLIIKDHDLYLTDEKNKKLHPCRWIDCDDIPGNGGCHEYNCPIYLSGMVDDVVLPDLMTEKEAIDFLLKNGVREDT